MDALRELHRLLVPGGLLVDTQPISPCPTVASDGTRLGALDLRDWRGTIDAVEQQVQGVLADGLFAIGEERLLVVIETFDNGPELVDTASGWQGTTVPPGLARAAADAAPPLTVEQDVRLRVLRAL